MRISDAEIRVNSSLSSRTARRVDVPVAWRSRASEYGVGKGGLRSITAVSDSLQGLASADHPGWKRLETDSCVRWIRRLVTGLKQ